MKISDYVLSEDYKRWDKDKKGWVVVPAGTFVKPIEYTYVPGHIRDENLWWDRVNEIFAYCSYGIIVVPRRIIREK